MKRRQKLRLVVAATLLASGVAAAALAVHDNEQDIRIDALEPSGPGPLDGLVFSGMLGPEGKPNDVSDTFVFAGGTFVSRECELRCEYPARPYQAVETTNGWEFTSTTRCPYKDATIVWNGTVEGDRLTGQATWTIRRWYWTLERDFTFEATLKGEQEARLTTN